MVCRKSAFAAIILFLVTAVHAQPLPESDGLVHEGVGSCASSICHGRVEPDPRSNVWLNEYRIWLREDKHSGAYKLLLNEQSKSIAKKLGLANAHEARECLACHADYVPVAMRGEKFRIEDGVGCESCHGGSQHWLKTHAEKMASHEANMDQGLFPSDQLPARSDLCLSCHLGTESKFATHEIMGAGHPRLSFDLQAFGVNQPYHYAVDEDYRARKAYYDDVQTWLSGLAAQSQHYVKMLTSSNYQGQGIMPELGFYECHTCHRPMSGHHWQRDAKYADAIPPGSVRLNDGPLQVLIVSLEVIDPALATLVLMDLNQLHKASTISANEVGTAAQALNKPLTDLTRSLAAKSYSKKDIRALRRHLLRAASTGEFGYYNGAEQAFFAIETLSIAANDIEFASVELDGWYATMKNEDTFDPEVFALAAGQVLGVYQ